MTDRNPFDFNDLSDLPEDMQKRLRTETNDNAKVYADVVRKGAEAGHDELNINQIMAAASRMGIEVPTQQTVRGYLNSAVEANLLAKPTRQTYGLPGTVAAEPEVNETVPTKGKAKAAKTETKDATTTSDESDDPLAGM